MARRARRSFSEVSQELLEEAVRMRVCPGIHFAEEPSGREAKVTGSGLGVWEVISTYKGVKGDAKKLGKWHPHLSAVQLRAALTYYDRFPGRSTPRSRRTWPPSRRARRRSRGLSGAREVLPSMRTSHPRSPWRSERDVSPPRARMRSGISA
jgi:uncharacterized protein (DUF433 family)